MSVASPHKKPIKSAQLGDTQIQHISLIQNQVQKRMINPQQSSYCSCNICTINYQIKQRGKTFLRQTSSNLKIQSSKMQQFLHLITAVNAKTYFKIDIPEICFFFKGQAKKLFKSNNSGVHHIEITPILYKNLANVFLENKKIISSNKNKNKQSTFDLNIIQQHDTHIKNFNNVMPSYKHGQQATKKTQILTFHNNHNYTEDSNLSFGRSSAQQICVMKSKDKGFQLINQKQLRQTLKSLLYLQNVEYIQTYIKPNDKQDQIYQANYQKLKGIQNQLMFSRSLIQVKTQINLINKFSKDYIPLQHLQNYETILKDIPQQYCLYQTYKMIHYIQLTKDVTIQKLGTFWLKNQEQEITFFGLAQFQWHQNQKFSVDVGQIEELKQIMSCELSDFQQQLLHAWENMKSRKIKPAQKASSVDIAKQLQYQKIKQQSLTRLAKQKEQDLIKLTRNKQFLDKSMDKSKSNKSITHQL